MIAGEFTVWCISVILYVQFCGLTCDSEEKGNVKVRMFVCRVVHITMCNVQGTLVPWSYEVKFTRILHPGKGGKPYNGLYGEAPS